MQWLPGICGALQPDGSGGGHQRFEVSLLLHSLTYMDDTRTNPMAMAEPADAAGAGGIGEGQDDDQQGLFFAEVAWKGPKGIYSRYQRRRPTMHTARRACLKASSARPPQAPYGYRRV